jgi:hypothetical protein
MMTDLTHLSFENIRMFCLPVLADAASLPSLQNPLPDPIMSHINPVHIFMTLVWCGSVRFGSVYLFIHSVTYVTLDTSFTDYNLQQNL